MAKLVQCKECGNPIAKNAKTCPSCGAKHKKFPLGIVAIILVVFFVVGVVAGTSSDEPEKIGQTDISQNPSTPSAAPDETEFTVGEIVELNNIVVTLTDISENYGSGFITPSDGKVYVVCEFNIENNSTTDIAVSSMLSFEAYIDDYSTVIDIYATSSVDTPQLDGVVAAGKKMKGVVGYEAPEGWETLEIRFTPDFWFGKDIIFTYSK